MIQNLSAGAAAKVRAIAVATAEELPEKDREGKIAIITSTPLGDVYVQNEEPTEPGLGDVWVKTRLASDAMIQFGNVVVYPASAVQMIDGAWKKVEAKTFRKGEWIDWWDGEYYLPGNMFEELTGGWKAVSDSGMSVLLDENGINFSVTSTTNRHASVYTVNKINITDFSTMIVTVALDSVGERFVMGLCEQNNANRVTFAYSTTRSAVTDGAVDLSLDISSANGEFYLGAYSYGCEGRITKVVLR